MSDGRPSASERFPDLYALLGLEPLEPDRARIQQSLKRLASQIQVHSQTAAEAAPGPLQIERARKLFELGKQQLLDPARKVRYDQQWQTIYGAASAAPRTEKRTMEKPRAESSEQEYSATADRAAVVKSPVSTASEGQTSAETWNLRELQALLPEGEPSDPLRPAEYLANRSPEVAARYAADFDKLLSLLAPPGATVSGVAVADKPGVTDLAAVQPAGEKPAVGPLPVDQSAVHTAELRQPPATPLAQRLRQKQGAPLLWRAIGVLAAMGIVLGIAYWRLQSASDQTDKDSALAARTAQNPLPTQPLVSELPSPIPQNAVQQAAPRRSGLPSVPGIEAIMASGDASPTGGLPGASAALPPATSAMPEAAIEEPAMASMSAVGAAEAQTSPPSDGERQQWTDGMLAVRTAIGQQQFTQATAQLDSLRRLAKTPIQTQQLSRLVTLEQLAQRFRQALDKALASMGAAETFSFGNSNLASFVEADGDRVILRIEGRNRTFAMPELPVEIAFAIVDMAMDREHPKSLAAKAAFILFHPVAQADDRAVKRAQQMMVAAVAAGAVPPDMQQAW